MIDQVDIDRLNSLKAVPVGPKLAAALTEINVDALSTEERVDLWIAHRRQVAHYEALSYQDMVAVERRFLDNGDSEQSAFEGAAAEFRICGMLTRRAAESELGFAEAILWRLPQVGAALRTGRIDARRARTLVYGTEHLPQQTARDVVDELIDVAPELTTSQLERRIRRRCIETNPDDAKDRYENTVEERRVMSNLTPDGTANFHIIDAAPHKVAAASRSVDWLAKELKRAGDKRPIDQIRADVALDLLTGAKNAKSSGKNGTGKHLGGVHIHTDLDTLARLNEHPGELAGYGPVIADIARQTTEQQDQAPWDYTVTDPATGEVISTGTTSRRPTAAQARRVTAEHRTCIFPGCQMPAVDSDLDHRTPWAETHRTDAEDLYPGCRYDHRIRHEHNWTYRSLPGGMIEFTTRLGRKYIRKTRPPPLSNG